MSEFKPVTELPVGLAGGNNPVPVPQIKKKWEVPEGQDPNQYIKETEANEIARATWAQAEEAGAAKSHMLPPDRPGNELPAPERLDEITFKVCGITIKMVRPSIPVDLKANRLLKNEQLSQMAYAVTLGQIQAILHVAEVNGNQVQEPANMVQVQALMNQLGQAGLEAVGTMYIKHFPPIQESEIEVISKS